MSLNCGHGADFGQTWSGQVLLKEGCHREIQGNVPGDVWSYPDLSSTCILSQETDMILRTLARIEMEVNSGQKLVPAQETNELSQMVNHPLLWPEMQPQV
jgi:hypothetical protein